MTYNTAANPQVDDGLRSYMIGIYNWMLAGLLISAGVSSFFLTGDNIAQSLVESMKESIVLLLVVLLSPLAILLFMSMAYDKLSSSTMKGLYILFTAIEGVSIGIIVSAYTGESVLKAFLSASIAFGGLSLWGYTTKKDLSGWGSLLLMSLFGLIGVSILNIFFPSPLMGNLIAVAGVLIFAALTAYDTQKLKELYYEKRSREETDKITIMGAINLYLDFVNIFLHLLKLMGEKK